MNEPTTDHACRDRRIFSTGCAGELERVLSGQNLILRSSGEYQNDRLLLGEEGLEALQRRGEEGKLLDLATSSPITWTKTNMKPLLIFLGMIQMENFKKCWKQHQNDKRTDSKDA